VDEICVHRWQENSLAVVIFLKLDVDWQLSAFGGLFKVSDILTETT